MGLGADDTELAAALVQHHLLLPDVATRRDLDDPTTIERVAAAVGSVRTLWLLAALTEADSLATGPAAWGPWKAGLVQQLAERVEGQLSGQPVPGRSVEAFPTAEQLAALEQPGRTITGRGGTLVVMADDRAGTFSRIAGTLALHGLDVHHAAAYSTEAGRALSEFRVTDPVRGVVTWDPVIADLERVLDGRLALAARIDERARTYNRRRPILASTATVTFDDDASHASSVIDVRAPDGIGVLYRITRAMADLDLDIRSARVQTMGPNVVDAFYVRDRRGERITEPAVKAEIERAILHSIRD